MPHGGSFPQGQLPRSGSGFTVLGLFVFVDEKMIADSTITCPVCKTAKTEIMPTDACQFFYDCTSCGTVLRPKPGDCCVFCSYGSAPCPPIQATGGKECCKSSN